MNESFEEVMDLINQVQAKHPSMNNAEVIEVVRLIVYNQISIDWLSELPGEICH